MEIWSIIYGMHQIVLSPLFCKIVHVAQIIPDDLVGVFAAIANWYRPSVGREMLTILVSFGSSRQSRKPSHWKNIVPASSSVLRDFSVRFARRNFFVAHLIWSVSAVFTLTPEDGVVGDLILVLWGQP